MKVEIWQIDGTRFHFGRQGLGQEKTSAYFPSDSVFAALVSRIAALYGDAEAAAFGKRFTGDKPPFVLTSAFPRAGAVLFFPPPQSSIKAASMASAPKPKQLKQVRYVSEGLFRSLLKGKSLTEVWEKAAKYHDSTVLLSKSEANQLHPTLREGKAKFWQIMRQPRVTIDRAVNSSTIYHTGQVVFNQDCGLWFGIHWMHPDPELADQLADLFLELGHAGLGGERSSGFGLCEITQTGSIQLPEAANRPWVNLSRYIPQEDEISALTDRHAAYKLEAVEGWVQTSTGTGDQRRKTAHMLVEGSVFGPLDRNAPGQMVDTQPSYNGTYPLDHPVWRNGFALGVGLEIGG